MLKYISIVCLLLFAGGVEAQSQNWTKEDSLRGEAMIKTIEQSLYYFYAENGSDSDYDSIIEALNFEADEVPHYSDKVY